MLLFLQDLVNDETSISGDSAQLMKFHGSYQQDDRERRTKGQGKFYQFMMRTRQPAGHVTNQLYKVMDDLADLVRHASPTTASHWSASSCTQSGDSFSSQPSAAL
jgi:sulfite reductase beta subunit-like hemoprotein